MARKLSKVDMKSLRYYVRQLRKRFPTKYPVQIRYRPLKHYHATRNFSSGKWRIAIAVRADYYMRLEHIIHEWAHILDSEKNGEAALNQHRTDWGKSYAVIFSFVERLEGKITEERHG